MTALGPQDLPAHRHHPTRCPPSADAWLNPARLSGLILTIFAMGLDMGLWRAEHGKLTSLTPTGAGLGSELEDYIESETDVL